MKKLQSIFVLIAIVSSSVVFANTDFETLDTGGNALINRSEKSAQVIEQFDELNVQSSGGPTENDFFEY
ncbi:MULTISPECIES: calmodulin [unclassified Pseudoalteromonas]|uniref:calmodulin n=1 Tax=unclassified Pseudoalteromonas TaxID=194690 RepID=UPI0013FD1AD8|nr:MULTISPECIES: calmodulin [unclassified Pseudoalteromonas]MBH0013920.1 calmodulin [Pseudoalteromonas sp. NZS100_1]MBH0037394.1 calmodulin [Pseudoalteromonas sp. SWN166]MBH0043192.1 calmodulin [Pseudoalteromonas sp. SWXJZ10B]